MATVWEVISQVSRHIVVKLYITSTALLHRHKLALHVPRVNLHTYSKYRHNAMSSMNSCISLDSFNYDPERDVVTMSTADLSSSESEKPRCAEADGVNRHHGREVYYETLVTCLGLEIFEIGSSAISFHCATQPTVRATANRTVYLHDKTTWSAHGDDNS